MNELSVVLRLFVTSSEDHKIMT